MMARGLFVGLATLDVVQLVEALPEPNQKIKALGFSMAAGGPASNAAVAFAHDYSACGLGGHDEAVLVTRVSSDAVGVLIRADLTAHGVEVRALDLPEGISSTVATIMVTASSGERAVVSALDNRPFAVADGIDIAVGDFDVVETDGYETDLTLDMLKKARAAGVTTVLDGGSMKDYTSDLLPLIDVAIVSEPFAGTRAAAEMFNFLGDFGVRFAAITRGEKPIDYWADGVIGSVDAVAVRAVDTLGAGDFFHGGFAKSIAGKPLTRETFVDALGVAAKIASLSVQSFGTRAWLAEP